MQILSTWTYMRPTSIASSEASRYVKSTVHSRDTDRDQSDQYDLSKHGRRISSERRWFRTLEQVF